MHTLQDIHGGGVHECRFCRQDGTLKVWDLRTLGSSDMALQPLITFRGHRHAVVAIAQHGPDVLSIAGSRLGVVSLQAPLTEHFAPVRLNGGRDNTSLVALAVLPCSRLVVTGTADGVVQICA